MASGPQTPGFRVLLPSVTRVHPSLTARTTTLQKQDDGVSTRVFRKPEDTLESQPRHVSASLLLSPNPSTFSAAGPPANRSAEPVLGYKGASSQTQQGPETTRPNQSQLLFPPGANLTRSWDREWGLPGSPEGACFKRRGGHGERGVVPVASPTGLAGGGALGWGLGAVGLRGGGVRLCFSEGGGLALGPYHPSDPKSLQAIGRS